MRPGGMTCKVILSELCSKRTPFDAFLMLKEIEEAEFLAFVESNVFSVLVMGHFELEQIEEAVRLLSSMFNRGIRLQAPQTRKQLSMTH